MPNHAFWLLTTPRILDAIELIPMIHIDEGRDYNNLEACRFSARIIGLLGVVDKCSIPGQNNCSRDHNFRWTQTDITIPGWVLQKSIPHQLPTESQP